MEDDETELQNPFPSPPSHYTKYSSHNLKLLALLLERSGDNAPNVNQHEALSDQTDIPEWALTQLEKPRVDWILDEPEPFYDVFGDRWFVRLLIFTPFNHSLVLPGERQDPFAWGHSWKSTIPIRLDNWYVAVLLDLAGSLLIILDRRPALRSILRSLLVTYSSLMSSLLLPPPLSPEDQPEWKRHVDWISNLATNLMAAANDLRPVQVI
jgi:mediator of RNA polymerase II transcription subunit 7